MIVRILTAIILALALPAPAVADEYQRVVIYYYDWDVSVRSALSVDDVRRRFHTKIEIVDAEQATKFANIVTAKEYTTSPQHENVDVRLVIDLWKSGGGQCVTYFANRFRLYSGNGDLSAEIDEAFRNRFRIAD